MKIGVIGTGCVGWVSGICRSEPRQHVVCVDVNVPKIEQASAGKAPTVKPVPKELMARNVPVGRRTPFGRRAGCISGFGRRFHRGRSYRDGMRDGKALWPCVVWHADRCAAEKGADAVALKTECTDFHMLDSGAMANGMAAPRTADPRTIHSRNRTFGANVATCTAVHTAAGRSGSPAAQNAKG